MSKKAKKSSKKEKKQKKEPKEKKPKLKDKLMELRANTSNPHLRELLGACINELEINPE